MTDNLPAEAREVMVALRLLAAAGVELGAFQDELVDAFADQESGYRRARISMTPKARAELVTRKLLEAARRAAQNATGLDLRR